MVEGWEGTCCWTPSTAASASPARSHFGRGISSRKSDAAVGDSAVDSITIHEILDSPHALRAPSYGLIVPGVE